MSRLRDCRASIALTSKPPASRMSVTEFVPTNSVKTFFMFWNQLITTVTKFNQFVPTLSNNHETMKFKTD